MAALSTYTGTTELEEIVPTEEIESYIYGANYPVGVAMQIAWARNSPAGSVAVKFPRFNAITVPAGTKTQTDVFTDVSIDMAEESITPGIVGFRMPISHEIIRAANSGVPAGVLDECMIALLNRMDVDLCGASTSASNATGAITDTFTLAKFRSAVAAWKALEVRNSARVALVLDHGPAKALLDSLHESGASMAMSPGDSLALSSMSGLLGTLHTFAIFEDLNVAAESTGRSNFMTTMGNNGGLALALTEMPTVYRSNGDDAVLRAVDYYVFRAWYGAGIATDTQFLEVLTAA